MIRFRFRSKKPITNDIQIISNTNEESKLLIRWLWVTPAADILSSLKKMLKSTKNRPKFLPQWKETRFEYQSTKSPLNFSSTNRLKGCQLFMMSRKVETVVENHLKIQSHDKFTPGVHDMNNKTNRNPSTLEALIFQPISVSFIFICLPILFKFWPFSCTIRFCLFAK